MGRSGAGATKTTLAVSVQTVRVSQTTALSVLTGPSQRRDVIGQFSAVSDDLSAVQPTRGQPREHVTRVFSPERLRSQSVSREVVQ